MNEVVGSLGFVLYNYCALLSNYLSGTRWLDFVILMHDKIFSCP